MVVPPVPGTKKKNPVLLNTDISLPAPPFVVETEIDPAGQTILCIDAFAVLIEIG